MPSKFERHAEQLGAVLEVTRRKETAMDPKALDGAVMSAFIRAKKP